MRVLDRPIASSIPEIKNLRIVLPAAPSMPLHHNGEGAELTVTVKRRR